MPNPIARNGKKTFWKVGEYSTTARRLMSNVPSPASTKIAISATHISTLPATRYSVSFIALYSFVRMNFGNRLLLPTRR